MDNIDNPCIGVLGATSLVGECLLPLLLDTDAKVIAFSRCTPLNGTRSIEWRKPGDIVAVDFLICLAPIWVLVDSLPWIEKLGVKKIVVLSSTSRFTKQDSSIDLEQILAQRLAEGERQCQVWAKQQDIDWVILRPTLIYGLGKDKNISEITRIIIRFGFFPLLGQASGLRQPVHAEDIAAACLAALSRENSDNHAYNLSGGETLSYQEMVIRVFHALGKRPRLIHVPLWMFKVMLAIVRILPRYKHWSSAMAERMNQDLVFDHSYAERDLGFKPRAFYLEARDLPK